MPGMDVPTLASDQVGANPHPPVRSRIGFFPERLRPPRSFANCTGRMRRAALRSGSAAFKLTWPALAGPASNGTAKILPPRLMHFDMVRVTSSRRLADDHDRACSGNDPRDPANTQEGSRSNARHCDRVQNIRPGKVRYRTNGKRRWAHDIHGFRIRQRHG